MALKEKRYEEALAKLDQLLGYGVQNHEVMIGKLMCLMELNRYKEAQDFCESLLIHKDEHYYHYVHIYLTILFQTSQYQLLMNQVEQELESDLVPAEMKNSSSKLI
ncbi:tetratricopeptide repeat protein [Lentibacillus sp. CBA3610]|uniref:tetratricopeptide repeat protein n=1 Tax=Lentibacillus sp. CBA3610 TaxID=2518176 RepID=UPI00159509BB|nr:tetratricopeptide repeat protein [Lentibacillus sp. CBA3610]